MEIVYRNLSDLKPNPKNPRTADPDAIARLAESIKKNPKFFEARPILLSDRTGELVIIGGERRSEAARLLNLKAAPTILMSGLTEEQEDEIMIRDNTHAGKWDMKKLLFWSYDFLKQCGVVNWDVSNNEMNEVFEKSIQNSKKEKCLTITIEIPVGTDRNIIKDIVEEFLEKYPLCKAK